MDSFVLRCKIRLCAWMLQFVNKQRPEIITNFIMDRANEIAVGATMAMLDSERITHCRFCPQRFGLKRHLDGYRCLNHSREEKALVAS